MVGDVKVSLEYLQWSIEKKEKYTPLKPSQLLEFIIGLRMIWSQSGTILHLLKTHPQTANLYKLLSSNQFVII